MCGVGVPVRRPSSATDPTSASISGPRPASTSCSIEVLCLPTFSAPSMRRSSVTRNSMPSLAAIACASSIMFAARARVSGNWQMSTSVACDSALIGLKQTLPHNLSQISARILLSTGAFSPACWNTSEMAVARRLDEPSSSPSGKRSPSTWRITPGAINSAAGYTTQPRMCRGAIFDASAPVGSTLCTVWPSNGPPWW